LYNSFCRQWEETLSRWTWNMLDRSVWLTRSSTARTAVLRRTSIFPLLLADLEALFAALAPLPQPDHPLPSVIVLDQPHCGRLPLALKSSLARRWLVFILSMYKCHPIELMITLAYVFLLWYLAAPDRVSFSGWRLAFEFNSLEYLVQIWLILSPDIALVLLHIFFYI